jgi:hypothetical protein
LLECNPQPLNHHCLAPYLLLEKTDHYGASGIHYSPLVNCVLLQKNEKKNPQYIIKNHIYILVEKLLKYRVRVKKLPLASIEKKQSMKKATRKRRLHGTAAILDSFE